VVLLVQESLPQVQQVLLLQVQQVLLLQVQQVLLLQVQQVLLLQEAQNRHHQQDSFEDLFQILLAHLASAFQVH